jgi:tetratricopeptide (TPR) repeat protein
MDLFVQSARRARAGFELTADDAPAVARVCALLGATPLAVELAAAWVRVLSCAEIADEIERAFAAGGTPELLATRARDVPEGHRSMAAVFDHSWQLLSAEERAVLGRLALFRGGFVRAAAEAVAGASLGVLSALSAKSLLRRVANGRYALHELVRQFAAGKLAQSPEAWSQAHDAHCAYYTRFVAERADALRAARQAETGLEVAAELDNVRAAWRWAIEHRRLAELRQAALPVYRFCVGSSRYREGAAMLGQAIERFEADPAAEVQEAVGNFLLGRGWLAIGLGHLEAAEADFRRLQALSDRLNRAPQRRLGGDSVLALGLIASLRGDYAAAIEHYAAGLALIVRSDDQQALAYPHLYLAFIHRALGDYAAADRSAQQALTLARSAGQPRVLGFAVNELGQIALARGDLAAAQTQFEAAFALSEKLDDASAMALDLGGLALVALARSRAAEAEGLFRRSFALYHDIGDQRGLVTALHGLGRAAAAASRPTEAWGHLAQALEMTSRAGFVPMSLSLLASLAEVLTECGAHERALRLVRVVLAQPKSDQATRSRASQLSERLGGGPGAAPAAGGLAGVIADLLAHPL